MKLLKGWESNYLIGEEDLEDQKRRDKMVNLNKYKIRCLRCKDILEIEAKCCDLTKMNCFCRTVNLRIDSFKSVEEFSKFLKEHDMRSEYEKDN